MRIEKIDTGGEIPGWISDHKAYLQSETEIIIKGGKKIISVGEKTDYVENHSIYKLCIINRQWKKLK